MTMVIKSKNLVDATSYWNIREKNKQLKQLHETTIHPEVAEKLKKEISENDFMCMPSDFELLDTIIDSFVKED